MRRCPSRRSARPCTGGCPRAAPCPPSRGSSAFTSSAVVSRPTWHDEVDDRAGRDRRAHRHAVELALELRHDDADRPRGAGRGRDQVDRGGAGAAQVLVRQVEDLLVVRVRVDRRHEPLLDAVSSSCEHLRDRRDAVRRARGVRDDVVLRPASYSPSLTPSTTRHVRVGCGCRDHHLLARRLEVLLGAARAW